MISIIALMLFSINSFSQYTISGTVINANNEKPDYFYAILLSKPDSSFAVGGAFEDGKFELTVNKDAEYILSISNVGYLKYYMPVDFRQSQHINLDPIVLKELTLDEVTINAKRLAFKKINGMTVVNVESTSLSQAGTAIDVLKRTPGLIIDQSDNVSVFGKGSPKIYVNGKEVKSNEELKLLQSDNIKEIKIDKTPGAKYDAETKAVILIETKKAASDFFSAELYNRSFAGRKFSNQTGLQLNNKVGRFTNYMSYQLFNYNSKKYSHDYEINERPTYTQSNISNSYNNYHHLNHSLALASDFAIDSINKLSIQYNGNKNNNSCETNDSQTISKTNTPEKYRKTIRSENGNKTTNSFSTGYNGKFKNNNVLTLQYDFANNKIDDQNHVRESNLNHNTWNEYLITNNENYNVNAIKSDFEFYNFHFIEIKGGVKASYLHSNSSTLMKNIADSNTLNNEANKINDRIMAGYIELDKKTDLYDFSLGLRSEQTRSKAYLDGESVLDTSYFNLFPSARLEVKACENLSISLKYNRAIDRPIFEEINPNISYVDSLAYSQGNPLIRPTYSQSFNLEFSLFGNTYLSGEYVRNKDERTITAFNDVQNPDILRYTYINIPKSEHLNLELSHEFAGKKMSSNSSAGIDFPFLNIPFQNESRKVRQPIWYISSNIDYTINKKMTVYCNASYQSKGEDLITYLGETFDVSMGINSSFFNKKLLIGFQVNDLFNKADMTWEDKYGNIISGQRPDFDTRLFRFSIKYRFNDFKDIFKSNSDVDNEVKRFEQRKR
jgi:hypothetical protein